MKIDLPVNNQPNAKDAPVRSSESLTDGSSGAFFVQIDQVLSTPLEDPHDGAENNAGHSSEAASADPMGPVLNAQPASLPSFLIQCADNSGSHSMTAAAVPPPCVQAASGAMQSIPSDDSQHQGGASEYACRIGPMQSPRRYYSHLALPATDGGVASEASPVEAFAMTSFANAEASAAAIQVETSSAEPLKDASESRSIEKGEAQIYRLLVEKDNADVPERSEAGCGSKFHQELKQPDSTAARTVIEKLGGKVSAELPNSQDRSPMAGTPLSPRDADAENGALRVHAPEPGPRLSAPAEPDAGDVSSGSSASQNQSSASIAHPPEDRGVPQGARTSRDTAGDTVREVLHPTAANSARFLELTSRAPADSRGEAPQPQELIFQIAERIRIQLRDGKEEIRIQLKPEHLGTLEIRAESTGHGVVARITTESTGIKSHLENNLHLLQQNLQDQGVKIDRIQILVHEGFDAQSGSGNAGQFGHAGAGQNDRRLRKPYETPGIPSDELVVDSWTSVMLHPNSRFYTVA